MAERVCHLCTNVINPHYKITTESKTFKEQLKLCFPMLGNISDECILCRNCESTIKHAYEFRRDYLRYQRSLGINDNHSFGVLGIFEYANKVMSEKREQNTEHALELTTTNQNKALEKAPEPKSKRSRYTSIKDQQGDKIYSCNFCKFDTSKKILVKMHVKKHAQETTYSCKFCEHKTQDSQDYKEHIRAHFGGNCYVCNLCQFTTTKKDAIDCHMQAHAKSKVFVCCVCGFKNKELAVLTKHLENHANQSLATMVGVGSNGGASTSAV